MRVRSEYVNELEGVDRRLYRVSEETMTTPKAFSMDEMTSS